MKKKIIVERAIKKNEEQANSFGCCRTLLQHICKIAHATHMMALDNTYTYHHARRVVEK